MLQESGVCFRNCWVTRILETIFKTILSYINSTQENLKYGNTLKALSLIE